MKQRKYKQLVKLGVSVLLLGCLLAPSSVPAQVPGVEHVVIVGVDGLSPDGVRKAKTPNLGRMMKEGAYTLHARGVMPTVSSPNWASMIMGAGPEQHGVTSNEWEPAKAAIRPTAVRTEGIFPTIFGVLRAQRPTAKMAVFHDWDGFGRLFERKAFDQINIPPFTPNSGSLYNGVGQCSAYSTSISTFICPSSPVDGTINYYNDVYSGFGDGNGNPIPNPPTNIWGRTDYFATPGFHTSLLEKLGYSQAATMQLTNTDSGVICDLSTVNATTALVNIPIPHVRIASITDGTSNTVMIGEDAARPVGYNHSRQIYVQYGAPVDGVINPTNGGAWADPFTYAHLDGSSADGIRG
jgi:hypothetical protein